jgi:hypothetical protein
MKIVAKYDALSVAIEGSAESLLHLSHEIQEGTGRKVLVLTVPQVPPSPYLGYARSLTIHPDDGNVCVSRQGEEILISGSSQKLAILASNISGLAEQPDQRRPGVYHNHLHIDYHPGHFYLKAGSLPLSVTRES